MHQVHASNGTRANTGAQKLPRRMYYSENYTLLSPQRKCIERVKCFV